MLYTSFTCGYVECSCPPSIAFSMPPRPPKKYQTTLSLNLPLKTISCACKYCNITPGPLHHVLIKLTRWFQALSFVNS